MTKFYVKSGELEVIVDAPVTPGEAAQIAMTKSLGGEELAVDGNVYVDERGYRGPKPSESFSTWAHRVGETGLPAYEFPLSQIFGDGWDK